MYKLFRSGNFLGSKDILFAMPCVEDWLTDPLSVAEGIFTEAGKPDHERVHEFFSNRLQNSEALKRVPSLNDIPSHLLKSKSLVRFRCMVQDMFDPEFYLAVYEVVNKADNSSNLRCGMYQDMVNCPENFELRLESPRNVTKERQTFYCVPIPGETEWAKRTFAGGNVASGLQSQASQRKNPGIKRSLDEEMDEGTATAQNGKLNQRPPPGGHPQRANPEILGICPNAQSNLIKYS